MADHYATVRPPHKYGEKSPTIRAGRIGFEVVTNKQKRMLLPVELERLQTLPDNYALAPWGTTKAGKKRWTSKTRRWAMLGSGWTVDVIAHILCNLNC